MTVINTNSAAMLTANSLRINENSMTAAMERLSTGKRINSAADDAAGLAIANRMTSQIRGLDQAARNANNAASMLQLADGAAEQLTNILQRMRELVVQAADGSNEATDVALLNVEFVEAAEEIDRIVDASEFNGKNLLDGSAGGAGNSAVTFQVGANAGQTLQVDFGDFNLADGGIGGAVGSVDLAGFVTADANGTNGDVVIRHPDGQTTTFTAAELTANVASVAEFVNYANAQFIYEGTNLTAVNNGGALQIQTNTNGNFSDWVDATDGNHVVTVGGTAEAETNPVTGSAGGPMGADLSSFASDGFDADLTTTLAKIETAIDGVATQRATFGATINRLEYAIDNLSSSSIATSSARSRIEDANYASETTALAKTQIISQAATAMLAQANQKSQTVLSLLQ